jgi:hypothetical protein
MIVINIKPKPKQTDWRNFFRRKQKVLALFSFRFDAHLVPDLIANIDPIVDGWIAFDDRNATGVFSSEVGRRRALLQAAKENGADWVLAVDPDERFEIDTATRISALTRASGKVAWGFNFRELYSPTAYRIDGVWGEKKRFCLFRMFDPSERSDTGLHDTWYPQNSGFKEKYSGLNLYHLKMISPARRAARSGLYEFLDPDHRDQPMGYDYLADEAGARFETIPPKRGYKPQHIDDDGLWMFNLEDTGG